MDSPLRNILVGIGPGGSPRALEAARGRARRARERPSDRPRRRRAALSRFSTRPRSRCRSTRSAPRHEECTERLHVAGRRTPRRPVRDPRSGGSGPPRAALLAELRACAHPTSWSSAPAARRPGVATALGDAAPNVAPNAARQGPRGLPDRSQAGRRAGVPDRVRTDPARGGQRRRRYISSTRCAGCARAVTSG